MVIENASAGLRKVLSRHGHGFHYAVLKRCLEVGDGLWRHAVYEYPVDLKGTVVHIDYILGSGTHLLVAECKRVAKRRWGFARGMLRVRGEASIRPRSNYLCWTEGKTLARNPCSFGPWGRSRPFDVVVELKGSTEHKEPARQPDQQDGEEPVSSKNFDSAVNQVLRGRGGLIDDLAARGEMKYGEEQSPRRR